MQQQLHMQYVGGGGCGGGASVAGVAGIAGINSHARRETGARAHTQMHGTGHAMLGQGRQDVRGVEVRAHPQRSDGNDIMATLANACAASAELGAFPSAAAGKYSEKSAL